jgi:hypothetical protein
MDREGDVLSELCFLLLLTTAIPSVQISISHDKFCRVKYLNNLFTVMQAYSSWEIGGHSASGRLSR